LTSAPRLATRAGASAARVTAGEEAAAGVACATMPVTIDAKRAALVASAVRRRRGDLAPGAEWAMAVLASRSANVSSAGGRHPDCPTCQARTYAPDRHLCKLLDKITHNFDKSVSS